MSQSADCPPLSATGDESRWHRYTPWAWQSAAYGHPGILPSIRSLTTDDQLRARPGSAQFVEMCSAYSLCLQLLRFRLGWLDPASGVRLWHQAGMPPENPALTIVEWVLGPSVAHLDSWLNHDGDRDGNPLMHGGSDSLHLRSHSNAPLNPPASILLSGAEVKYLGKPRFVAETSTYLGWYEGLNRLQDSMDTFDIAVDVYCKPVGWLGTYIRSDHTGLWHACTEQVHLWNHPDKLG